MSHVVSIPHRTVVVPEELLTYAYDGQIRHRYDCERDFAFALAELADNIDLAEQDLLGYWPKYPGDENWCQNTWARHYHANRQCDRLIDSLDLNDGPEDYQPPGWAPF